MDMDNMTNRRSFLSLMMNVWRKKGAQTAWRLNDGPHSVLRKLNTVPFVVVVVVVVVCARSFTSSRFALVTVIENLFFIVVGNFYSVYSETSMETSRSTSARDVWHLCDHNLQ